MIVNFEDKLILYVSEAAPLPAFATAHLIHEHEMFEALGAYTMLMPQIVVIDQASAAARETYAHLQDVLPDAPQKPVLVVLLGETCGIESASYGVRLHITHTISPFDLNQMLRDALKRLTPRPLMGTI